ncbi:porin [Vibrio sp. JPW-9-11-11]|uniref:porin n=1 Tax=Vibrio sp. JPW-9-11-11 TaxID=1416532 RepID=UPI001594222A|nr:porin [Vibrio sp. JPW-9-11-11]NVD06359.1 porin [Vibrio sp. JPW-9-11-11]
MKKTLVALLVASAATAAPFANAAIELYNEEGVTVNLKGDIEVVYRNDVDGSSQMQQRIEDADFGFDIRYMVNTDWTVGAYWEFNGSESTNSEITRNGDTYVAAYHNTAGSIKFGRLCTAADDLGIGSDEAFGISTLLDAATDECSDEAVRYDYDNGTFYATVGYVQNKLTQGLVLDGTDLKVESKQRDTQDTYLDARAGYRFADFDVSAFVAQYNAEDETAKKDDTAYALEVVYGGIENVGLSVAYYAVDADADNSDNNIFAFAADYTMGKVGFAAGYSKGDHDQKAKEADRWFVNTTYAVAPNTKLYAEVGGLDQEGVEDNTGLAIGVEASF